MEGMKSKIESEKKDLKNYIVYYAEYLLNTVDTNLIDSYINSGNYKDKLRGLGTLVMNYLSRAQSENRKLTAKEIKKIKEKITLISVSLSPSNKLESDFLKKLTEDMNTTLDIFKELLR